MIRTGALVGLLAAVVLLGPPLPDPAPAMHRAASGTATWLCDPPRWSRCTAGYGEGSLVAAAGSELQHAGWRGSWVRVSHGGRSVEVQLVDSCACKGERIIDLYAVAFRRLAPTSAGVIDVQVVPIERPTITLPPTDTAPVALVRVAAWRHR